MTDKVMTLHPEGKAGVNVDKRKYDSMRRAILKVVGRGRDGVPFGDLRTLVEPHLGDVFEGASVGWYVTTVKLDLEARGELERVPGVRPQRLRRPR